MPHTQSAKKRLRQSEDRRIRNKTRTTELKTIRKRLLRAVHDGQKQEAETLYRDLSKRLDQAASINTIHPNAAARTKARMARVIAGGPAAAAVVIGRGAEAATKTAEPAKRTEPSKKGDGKKPTA
jgi:small subunit ribosomal protein S20